MHVRCPQCCNPIALSGNEELSNLECPSCGSHFQLVSDETTTLEQTYRPLAHFELLHQVGVGRFGSVWKARDTELDRFVAIKIPRQENLDPASEDQFFREARAAAQLKHPHIVSVHEVGRQDGTVYIVCDFIDGIDLSGWLRGNRLTVREAAELCLTLADALEHAHQCGIIHRDGPPHVAEGTSINALEKITLAPGGRRE
jgi:serine/threonine protein kinase